MSPPVVMLERRVGGAGGQVSPRLGEILIGRQALERHRLEAALVRQPESGRQLGDLLVAQGWASGGAVAGALAEQWDLEFADLERVPPDGGLVRPELTEDYLRHRILPWQQVEGVTVHVTDRPEQAAAALTALGQTGCTIAVAPSRQLDAALGRVLGGPLAKRAAERTAAGESVRGLGWARLAAGLCVVLAVLLLIYGGTVGLALAFGSLLALNLATTVLRLLALAAGLRKPPEAENVPVAAPGTVDLAAWRPLPLVTLMVPLFHEAEMVGEITRALAALDYPAELLDVMLLLEEGDAETRAAVAALELPGWIAAVVVPDGAPRTKPRAMNFALDFAVGEIIGILDAEDRPDPDQLRRVAEYLRAAPPEVACAQCQLSYYNATENWITRCFQIEYSIWFDVLLSGFQRLGLPIPLGGTSVYFRRNALERLGGWDAHNVTEDADLGMRLARRGMRCAVLRSVTLEEANCRVGPWIRQRSRWLKGYLLTWLSHMRSPVRLWRESGGVGFVALNVLFLGGAATYLAMPLFWLSVIGGVVTGHTIWGEAIPGWALWPLGISLAVGQAVMLGCAALAMVRRGSPGLLIWVPTLPFYWTLGAIAAWKAVFEMVWAPYYWDKTTHGISRVFRQAAK
ncbi:MAG TPA: glycosyltransferase family 2 protein [Thermohalobaculum sp.]|nr:glycosyltransferase family 2 protein [Thermohalobaculum sp.]